MSYNIALQSKQLLSQSARMAIRAFQNREFPERHELTEMSFFARVEGRPNDEDLVVPIHVGWGRQDSNRWALLGKGLVLSAKGSVILRNELENEVFATARKLGEEVEGDRFSFAVRGEVDAQGQFHNLHDKWDVDAKLPEKLEKLVKFMNPEQDAMEDMQKACTEELGRLGRVFFFDRRSVGASKFGRVHFDFVTDCKQTAKALGELLSQTPKSSSTVARKSGSALTLLHCAYRDPEIPSVDTYAAVSATKIVARGQFEVAEMLEVMAELASKPLLSERNSLLVRGNVFVRNGKQVEVVIGEQSAPKPGDAALQAAHHFAWGHEGVTRAWDAVLVGRTAHALAGEPQTLLPQPTKITFAKASGITKLEDASKVIVGNVAGKSVSLFEKLVKDHNVSVVFEK
ncbi:hypothetical protein BASA81_001226 [Batrachochytrium salamandrivorans]|nr:hypothetical protein BASA81_001226 [Batrachochytrium salamandrivorans]